MLRVTALVQIKTFQHTHYWYRCPLQRRKRLGTPANFKNDASGPHVCHNCWCWRKLSWLTFLVMAACESSVWWYLLWIACSSCVLAARRRSRLLLVIGDAHSWLTELLKTKIVWRQWTLLVIAQNNCLPENLLCNKQWRAVDSITNCEKFSLWSNVVF